MPILVLEDIGPVTSETGSPDRDSRQTLHEGTASSLNPFGTTAGETESVVVPTTHSNAGRAPGTGTRLRRAMQVTVKRVAFLLFSLTALSAGAISIALAASPQAVSPATEREIAIQREDPSDGPVVTMKDLAFTPNVIRVKRGKTITWVNSDDFQHTATADDGRFHTGTLAPGERVQITFEETGTFPYYCAPHPFMKASVIVEE